jgi:hypothetical protein
MMLIIVFAFLTASTAAAQELSGRARVWGAVGAGGSVPTSGGDAITNMAQIVYQKNTLHAAMRILLLHDIDRNTNEIGEIGPLYGRTREHSWGRSVIATGFSWVGFYRHSRFWQHQWNSVIRRRRSVRTTRPASMKKRR